MISRFASALAVLMLSSLTAAGAEDVGWHGIEVVEFTDFDDVLVKVDGKEKKAFLTGLRPLREAIEDKEQRERGRAEVATKLRKNTLFARILTKKNVEVVGLSIDTFMHHKNDFDHRWNPSQYPYCWSGWGAYNLNTYFLWKRATTFVDQLGDREEYEPYREQFREAAGKIEGKAKK